MFQPTNPEHAAIIDGLVKALAEMPVGGTMSYADVKQIAGRDVQHRYRYLLTKARTISEKELGCIFECVRGVGIKRLTAAESPEIGLSTIRGVRRKAKRGASRLGRIDSNSLSDTERKRAISYGSLLSTIAMMADGNKARTIAAVVDPAAPIPPENILMMFAK